MNRTSTYKTTSGEGFCCEPQAQSRNARSLPTQNVDYEKLQYYYHSDHLGSASYITNLDGEVVQHVEYVPFGEVFIEERNNTWNTPYLFNGKELDEETGLYYYGARYYNPRISLWYGVDPLAEKYPNESPYCYTQNNPITFLDPNGKEKYYASDGTYLGWVGTNTNVRVINSSLTKAQALNLISNSPAPLLESANSRQQLLDQSTSLIDYAENVNDVLSDAPLETYADHGSNCNTAALAQMDEAGQSVKNKYHAIQTDVDNSKQPARQQLTENAMGGAIYTITQLKEGNPVMIGVKETTNSGGVVNVGNYNRNTGHFVVISSMQKSGNDVTFGYYDNASAITGKSADNRLSLNNTTGVMTDNTNIPVGGVQSYQVSEVRVNEE